MDEKNLRKFLAIGYKGYALAYLTGICGIAIVSRSYSILLMALIVGFASWAAAVNNHYKKPENFELHFRQGETNG